MLSSMNHLRKSSLPGKDAASKKMSCIDSIQFALVSFVPLTWLFYNLIYLALLLRWKIKREEW